MHIGGGAWGNCVSVCKACVMVCFQRRAHQWGVGGVNACAPFPCATLRPLHGSALRSDAAVNLARTADHFPQRHPLDDVCPGILVIATATKAHRRRVSLLSGRTVVLQRFFVNAPQFHHLTLRQVGTCWELSNQPFSDRIKKILVCNTGLRPRVDCSRRHTLFF